MLWKFVRQSLKYQIYPLPTDPVELEKLAMNLNVSLTATWMSHGVLDTAEVQRRIRDSLSSFRSSVLFWISVITAFVAAVTLLAKSFLVS